MFGKRDKAGITAWAGALKANTSITALNLAKNGISASDTKILAPAIRDNGALTQLDISNNKLVRGEPIKDWEGDITGYKTETAGVLQYIPSFFRFNLYYQVLLLSPMPSRIWGR
jgi:hypothetical protein